MRNAAISTMRARIRRPARKERELSPDSPETAFPRTIKSLILIYLSSQVRTLFLQWLPWALRMSRPGKPITRKSILMTNRMNEIEMKKNSSKSLLANVLDMDDDFRWVGLNFGSCYSQPLF